MNTINFKSTIIIPAFTHPNFLDTAVKGLVRNSYYQHKIIIVGSNPKRIDWRNEASDFKVNKNFERYQKYGSTREFLVDNAEFILQNGIIYIDATDTVLKIKKAYLEGRVYPEKVRFEDGVDIAIKNNVGLEYVSRLPEHTKWIIPNWDDDFYPGFHWDRSLFYYAEKSPPDKKFVFIPTHVQPYVVDKMPTLEEWRDYWNVGRRDACNRITLPIIGRDQTVLTKEEFFAFCRLLRHDDAIIEECGIGLNLNVDGKIIEKPKTTPMVHYLPILYHAHTILDELKSYSYKGTGYDIEMDARLAGLGYSKISPRDSFIMHKGWIIEE